MALSKCSKEGCDPVEQIRGLMTDLDYFDVLENDTMEAFTRRVPRDYHNHVELDDSNRNDIRIICRKCHDTLGWTKADAPGMPGAGRDYMMRKWNEKIGAGS